MNWLNIVKKLKGQLVMSPIPEYGDLMTLEDWLECVDCGAFIDYDGHGKYATKTEMSDCYVRPSDVRKGNVRKDFTHIVWFNR